MPPKAKYTKEEIIEQAVTLIVSDGIEKLTARSLADSLGISVKPIFTAFENMEDVKKCAFDYAFSMYHKQFENISGNLTFKMIGYAYIDFAVNQPKLFQLLFMKFQVEKISFEEFMNKLDDNYNDTISFVMNEFKISELSATELYKHMWIYAHGMAVLCATNQCKFSAEEIESMLDVTCAAFYKELENR